jgi:nucleoid-associated protein YgaU
VVEIKEPKIVLLPAAVIGKTYKLYTVAEGETLGEIAQRELGSYRMWRKIVALNNINDPSRISPGDVLRMPVVSSMVPVFEPMKPLGTVIHTVVEDDTFSSLAGDYFGDINLFGKILDANPMVDPNRMKIGMRIVIPKL